MELIDARRADLLYSRMGPAIEASGGIAGNTAAGVASFGGRASFIGKVSSDVLDEIYTHDMRAQGVAFDTKPLKGEPQTARSIIFVRPDGERSMNTYLGACVELGLEDFEADKVSDAPRSHFSRAICWIQRAGTRLSGKLPFWRTPRAGGIDNAFGYLLRRPVSRRVPPTAAIRHRRARLCEQPRNQITLPDRLLGGSARRYPEGLQNWRCHALRKRSVIVCGDEAEIIEPAETKELIDTTGADDFYAAGFSSVIREDAASGIAAKWDRWRQV
ncbi:hypothetical protein M728_005523 (plasmid) [Ensifer sp. WSM1721]